MILLKGRRVNSDEQSDTEHHTPNADTAFADGIEIEGLRPPLSSAQRTRRVVIAVAAVAAILALLLWPTIAPLRTVLPISRLFTQATATTAARSSAGFVVSSSGSNASTVVMHAGLPPTDMCPVTPLIFSSGWAEMHPDTFGNGDVWALLLTSPPLAAGHDENIVWRATGSGTFQVVALDASGERLSPKSGPDLHIGSKWHRPGDEWGTVFNFPHPGCWQVHATRGADLTADLWLAVNG
jgi:hypothetical protein